MIASSNPFSSSASTSVLFEIPIKNGYSVRQPRFQSYYSRGCGSSSFQLGTGSTFLFTSIDTPNSPQLLVTSSSTTIGGRSGQIEIEFQPVTTMLNRGFIYLQMPRLYTSRIPGDTNNYCVADMKESTPNVVFASPSGTLIQPTRLSTCVIGLSGCTSTITSNACTLRIEYSYTGDIDTNKRIKIQVSSYFSPLNYQSVIGFSIITSETVGFPSTAEGRIESIGTTGQVAFSSSLTPKLLNTGSVTLLNASGGTTIKVAQRSNQITLSLNVDFPLLTPCSLLVTFPPEIKIGINDAFQPTILAKDGFLSGALYSSHTIYSTSAATGTHNIVKVTNACDNGDQEYPNTGSITFGNIVSPAQIKDVLEFNVTLIDDASSKNLTQGGQNQGYVVRQNNLISGTIGITALTGFIAYNPTVGEYSDYIASFTLDSDLYYQSQFTINLPQFVTVDTSKLASSGVTTPRCKILAPPQSTGVILGAKYTSFFPCYLNSNNQIVVKDIFISPSNTALFVTDTLTTTSREFKIEISNAGKNPGSVRSTGNWKVTSENYLKTSLTSSNFQAYTVDTGTAVAFTTTEGIIPEASVSISSPKTTSAQNQLYTFKMKLAHSIPENGQVTIILPSQLSVAQQTLVRSSCVTNRDTDQFGSYAQTCSVQTVGTQTTIIVPLDKGFSSTSIFSLEIKLQGIQNPRNFDVTGNFQIVTKDKAGYMIDKTAGTTIGVLSVFMDTPALLSDVSVTPSNYTNGATCSYLVTIVTTNSLMPGDQIIMSYQNIIVQNIGSSVATVNGGQLTVLNGSPTFSSTDISFKIGTLGQSTGTFSFTITKVINPPATKSYPVFTNVVIKDSSGFQVMSKPSSLSVTVQPLFAANILTYSLKQDRLDFNTKTKYTLSFKTSNPIAQTGSIVVTWPVQVTKPQTNPTCSIKAQSSSTQCTFIDNTRSIIFNSVFGSSGYNGTIDIVIDGMINPVDNRALNGFLIQTFNDQSFSVKIDKLDDDILKPSTPCNYPCKSCSNRDQNFCQSCWSDTGLPFLMTLSNSTCKSNCDDGYSSNGSPMKACVRCDPSCNLCVDNGNIGDRSRCITCASGYNFRYTPLQQCLRSCTNGFYQSSPSVCQLCSATCQTCDKSASNCTSCNINSAKNRYLYENQCIESCPAQFTNIGAECKKCDAKCSTCKNSTSQCLSCDSSSKFKFYFGFDCLDKCPEGTNPDNQRLKCFGCLKGCQLCDSLNQSKCLQCQTPLLEYKGSCVVTCPSGTSKSFFGATCTSSFFINIPNIPYPHLCGSGVMLLLTLISYMKDKRTLILTNIIVLWGPIQLISFISQVAFSYLYGTMNYAYTSAIAAGTYIILNIAFSITFQSKIATQDIEYMNWKEHYKVTSRMIILFSGLLSFKILRLHYSFLFGYDKFKATFDKPGVFQRQIIIFTVLHLLFSTCVILGVDIMGLLTAPYGSQLSTTLIETAILSVSLMILEFIELCKLKHYLGDDIIMDYDALVNQMNESMDKKLRQDMLKQIMNHVKAHKDLNLNNRFDELLTENGPRRTKSMIEFGNDLEDDPRATKSEPHSPRGDHDEFDRNTPLPTIDNVYAESKPADPLGRLGKTYSEYETQVNPDDFDKFLSRKGGDFVQFDTNNDNQSKKKSKNKKRGRKNQYYTQIDAEDDEEASVLGYDEDGTAGAAKDDLGVIKEEEDDEDDVRNKSPAKKRGAKQLQSQEAELLKKRQLEEEAVQRELQNKILREQEEQEAKDRRAREEQEKAVLAEKMRVEKELKDKSERDALEKARQDQMKKLEEEEAAKRREIERKQKEIEDKKREEERKRKQEEMEREILLEEERRKQEAKKAEQEKKRQEMEQKRIADELEQQKRALEQEVEMKKIPDTFSQPQVPPEPIVQCPPDKEKRNFNENDILGDLDRDDKGNVIVLQDEAGNYVDKRGRPVNERGYLKDKNTGDIIENYQNSKMFDQKDIDERGEVPAPYCVEKYNFNPFQVHGDFDYDRVGRPIINKNMLDKKGRPVNKKGLLVDGEGNVCDYHGRKKFDKKQLTPDQDFPRLFNLNGRRFDILDLCGQFQRDQQGNLIFKKNQKGQMVDDLGRLVNQKGYLVDEQGNIVDKDKKKMFEKKFLKNGEFPKIFPFTKFNIKKIQGDFEMDPLGNPILDKGPQGELLDRQGKRVNSKGYLIDKDGNVIDKQGKMMFEKAILDSEDDIPKVFRTGLLKSDTGSSLSRLMSEIERNQPSEYGNPQWRRQQQQEQLRKQQRDKKEKDAGEAMEKLSGNTSVDSMMEDTPSNYNVANQRFDQTQSNLNAKSIQLQQQSLMQNQVSSQQRNLADLEEGSGSGFDGDYAANDENLMKKRKLKKKKKAAPVQTFGEPSEKDLMMAKAYGGAPRGQPKRVAPKPQYQQRDSNTPASNINRNSKNQMSKVSGLVAGFNRDGGKEGERHSVSMMQLEELKEDDGQYAGGVNMTHQGESNDASFLAVPDHHQREQRLKQKKMNELKNRNKGKRRQGGGGDPDFEKMFGKDIDEFLEDSDWDIESFDNMSQYSKGTSRSLYHQDGRIRGLESIYLQRIETSMKKGHPQMHTTTKNAKPKKVQAKFRPMQDRFINDPSQMAALDNERMSGNVNEGSSLSQQRISRPHFVESAAGFAANQIHRTAENVATKQLSQKQSTSLYK